MLKMALDLTGANALALWPAFLALSAMMMVGMLVVYIYMAWAWMTIAKKLKYKRAWLAWIPFANISMILQMGGFHWAWVFLLLVPIVGWLAVAVLAIMAQWKIFEKRKYPGWLSLLPALAFIPWLGWIASLAYLVVIGMVAWSKK